ncbi:MAG: prenyltransferase [Actinomycetota bacterium]|nr:prenyltransferase [Actinomycetota bacterium]MEE2957656.1 prenyltransferase [Actinomycetota bacterium]
MSLPEVPGLLTADEVRATAATIAEWQLPDGMVPWFPGGHADPWNHVEAAMALAVTGHLDEAEAAYRWLVATQHESGAWHQYYLADGIEDEKFDANVIAYVATGVWHHWLLTGDRGFLESMWPVVERAVDFVLDLQTPRGEVLWARHPDGTPWSFALLTGSSSICHSLRCAVAVAEEVGSERPDWELSLGHLAHVVHTRPDGAFAPKERWAMDWYYPVLGGAVTGDEACAHLIARHDEFVVTGPNGEVRGVRCVSDKDWATAAETAECALAHQLAGEHGMALDLLAATSPMRRPDGRYLTGLVYPDLVTFPTDECSTYTAAAVVLAADALGGCSPASGLFVDHSTLPDVIDVEPTRVSETE